jgi:hypothetical protein
MAKITGYDGGNGEGQLIAALKQEFAAEVNDAWEKIRTTYMYRGSIIEIAIEMHYIKTSGLGFQGWLGVNVGFGATHARECLRCWKLRRDFDRVVEWVKTNNSFRPSKLSGPVLYLEAHKAWSDRLKSDVEKDKRRGRKPTLKEMQQALAAYRGFVDRIGDEHVALARDADREPRVWLQISQERAVLEQELGEDRDDSRLPVEAKRPVPKPDDDERPDDDGDTTSDGQHPGGASDPPPAPNAVTPDGATGEGVTGEGQHPGVGDDPPPPGFDRPDFLDVAAGLAVEQRRANLYMVPPPPITSDPSTVVFLADVTSKEERTAVEEQYGLRGWSGVSSLDETALRNKRAAFLKCAGHISEDDLAVIRKADKTFLRGVTTVAQVWNAMPAERARQQQAEAERLARKTQKRAVKKTAEGDADTEAAE